MHGSGRLHIQKNLAQSLARQSSLLAPKMPKVQTADQKARLRYRKAFEAGKEPPLPRTEANKAILEEIRAEVQKGRQSVSSAGQ